MFKKTSQANFLEVCAMIDMTLINVTIDGNLVYEGFIIW